MRKESTLITNIQRMCMDDGPGIRTTVFFKGCNLHCPWCANPENIRFCEEPYQKDGVVGVYGAYYRQDELLDEILKDKKYWKRQGGVTFSGGEPLLHTEYLLPVLKKLKDENIHVAVETALFVDRKVLEAIISYVDLFLVDMKLLQPEMCKEILGGNASDYLENLEYLVKEQKDILLRIPCNEEYTLQKDNVNLILAWCEKHPHLPLEIFAVHSLGKTKYNSLGRTCKVWEKVSDEQLYAFAEQLRACGNKVKIQKL